MTRSKTSNMKDDNPTKSSIKHFHSYSSITEIQTNSVSWFKKFPFQYQEKWPPIPLTKPCCSQKLSMVDPGPRREAVQLVKYVVLVDRFGKPWHNTTYYNSIPNSSLWKYFHLPLSCWPKRSVTSKAKWFLMPIVALED